MTNTLEEYSLPTKLVAEKLTSCPWCGSKDFRHLWTSFDRMHLTSRQPFSYQNCRDCGLIFQSPRPPESEIHRFYPVNYGPYQGAAGLGLAPTAAPQRGVKGYVKGALRRAICGFVAITERRFPRSFARRYTDWYQPSKPGQTLLDFGCGSDQFLNTARAWGWNTIGMDFNHQAVATAKAKGHRAFVCSDDAWDQLADASCHFIRLSHVMEHLYDPQTLLRRFVAKMAPGGVLHLALPNPSSISAKIFGSRWFPLECPRHIMLYTASFLKRELPHHGFRVAEVLHEPVTKDFARSYAFRQFDGGRIEHHQIDGFVHHRLLNDTLAVPMRLLAGLGIGERIHVFARKPDESQTSFDGHR